MHSRTMQSTIQSMTSDQRAPGVQVGIEEGIAAGIEEGSVEGIAQGIVAGMRLASNWG